MDVRPGRYRHFKGGEYEVLGAARCSGTGQELAACRALYGEGGLWVRSGTMWNGTADRDGYHAARFSLLEEQP